MRFLLAPFLLATSLWHWAAPAIPDPGLRYATLFILPQLLIQQGGGWLLVGVGQSDSAVQSCITVFCCCCVPIMLIAPDWRNRRSELIPEFESSSKDD